MAWEVAVSMRLLQPMRYLMIESFLMLHLLNYSSRGQLFNRKGVRVCLALNAARVKKEKFVD